MSDKFESYVTLFVLWAFGCVMGWFMAPDMPLLGALVGGNSLVTCSTFLEVHGNNH